MVVAGALYAFLDDLVTEGVEPTLDRFAALGLTAAAVAATYHSAKDVLPHRPEQRVVYRDGGLHYFKPDPARYPAGLPPKESWLCDGSEDPFAAVQAAAAERGLELHAWTVFLHNSRLASARPDCAVRNAFGDVSRTDLCPAGAEVRDYAVGLADDLARRRPDAIIAESLHYPGAEHGYHHERRFAPLGPVGALLLGVCFCDACSTAAAAQGADMAAAAQLARDLIDRSLRGEEDAGEATWAAMTALGSDDLIQLLRARQEVVADLAAAVADAARSGGSRLVFMDQMGAAKGYATGEPSGAPAAELAWQLGVPVADVAASADQYAALLYARDPARIGADAAAYAAMLGDRAPLRAVLRPMSPDCDSAANLAEKLSALADSGAAAADFYHYGLAPLSAIERIGEAVRGHG